MPQNSFEQLKMSKKFGGLTAPPPPSWVTRLTWRASVGAKQFSDFFSLSVDMSGYSGNMLDAVLYVFVGCFVVRGCLLRPHG